jgi:hypothetical protein
VELGEEGHAVLESTVPMAIESSPGHWAAMDLGVSEVGGGFEPANPLVGVRIPKRLSDGVQLLESELSLTPVGGSGAPLGGGEGEVDGSAVVYANTQTDADTVVKSSTFGVAVDALLRSVESPQKLDYRVGLPQGATLVSEGGLGGVRVLKEGTTLAMVPAPWARDAAGSAVPVTMSASGDMLTVSVEDHSGSYEYPVVVDPELVKVTDGTLTSKTWQFSQSAGGSFTGGEYSGGSEGIAGGNPYSSGEWAALTYHVKGKAQAYEVNTVTMYGPTWGNGHEFWLNANATDSVQFVNAGGGIENSVVVSNPSTESEGIHSKLCASAGSCALSVGSASNSVSLEEVPTPPVSEGLGEELKSATVSLSQPKEAHATVSYNTTSPELGGTVNVFYGGKEGWIGPNSGAFEVKAEDVWLGVAETRLEYPGSWYVPHNYRGTSSCAGVQ